jgi:hypothetical protein
MENGRKHEVWLETVKLFEFCKQNQLVQANTIVTKLEQICYDEIFKNKLEDTDPLWQLYHKYIRIKNLILGGKSVDCVNELKSTNIKFLE